MQESWEEMREGKLSKVTNGGGERGKSAWLKLCSLGKKGAIYMSPRNRSVENRIFRFKLEPDYPVSG